MKLFLLVFITFTAVLRADVYCSHCKNKISGQYLLDSKKNPYCSQKCFSSILPSCTVCGKKISGYYKISGSHRLCSDKCLSAILPKCNLCNNPTKKVLNIDDSKYCQKCGSRPRCFSCSHPFSDGFKHADGRIFCAGCKDDLIFKKSEALKIYKEAQKHHSLLTGIAGKKLPPMVFCDYREMKKHTGQEAAANGMSLRGYYQQVHNETTVTEDGKVVKKEVVKVNENIYLLNGVKKESLLVTAVHELTHDWLTDYYPGIKVAPLWMEEGACQYLSWIFSKNQKYTKQAAKIEAAKDPVYGKGFQFFHRKFGDSGWKKALSWMAEQGYRKSPPPGASRPHSH